MKSRLLVCSILILFTSCLDLIAQKKCGKLKDKTSFKQEIYIAVYHQYQLNLKQGTIALLNLSDFDVRTELTVVNSDGSIIERTNTAGMADFLIFEAPENGNYQFYINTLEEEAEKGKYTLTSYLIEPKKEGRLGQIKQLLQLLEKPDRAGAAITIVEKEKIIFEYYHGFADVENRVKNNENTVFELASVSKQFTGMAIAKLAEEGKLSVNDDIRKYFPELPKYKTPVKIKHLLNHTCGIIDSDYPLALAGFENDPIDLNRVLNFLKKTPELYFDPGSEFAYSNDAYTLLAEIVHRVTKQSFSSWMKANVFDPLGMTSTLIRDSPEIVIPNRAISYVSYTGDTHFRRRSFDFYAPGGCGVRSSITDLVKWANYMNKGYHSKENLFKRLNQLDTFSDGKSMQYAYGGYITDFKGIKRFSHLGLSAGFTTALSRFPDEDMSVIVLGNDGEFRNYYLSGKIYEIFLSEKLTYQYEKFEGIETKEPTKDEEKKKLENVNLTDYEGTYFSDQLNAVWSFEVNQDTLFAQSIAYKRIPLIISAKDTLNADEDFMETIIFKRDDNSKVSACKIYNEDDDYGISFRKIPSALELPRK